TRNQTHEQAPEDQAHERSHHSPQHLSDRWSGVPKRGHGPLLTQDESVVPRRQTQRMTQQVAPQVAAPRTFGMAVNHVLCDVPPFVEPREVDQVPRLIPGALGELGAIWKALCEILRQTNCVPWIRELEPPKLLDESQFLPERVHLCTELLLEGLAPGAYRPRSDSARICTCRARPNLGELLPRACTRRRGTSHREHGQGSAQRKHRAEHQKGDAHSVWLGILRLRHGAQKLGR